MIAVAHNRTRGAHRLVPLAPRHLQMSAPRGVRGNSEDLDRQAAEIQAVKRAPCSN